MRAASNTTIEAAAGPPAGRGLRLRERLAAVSPDTWAIAAVVAAVLVAHLPYLLGFFDPNPLGPRSGLASSVLPGPLSGQPTIDPNNGFISQALSHRAALDLIHLHLPWWNPYEGSGAPLAGEMQSAAFFPPTLLTLFSNGQVYEHMLLEIVAGIATYLLLRRIRIARPAAVAGAVAFALNGTFAWFSHATVNPIAFLPLLLLGIELAYSAAAEDRHGGWWLIALSLALSLYAGFPEVAYVDALLAVLWLAWRCGCVERARVRALLAKSAAGAACGALLSAPLAIAALDYVNHAYLGLHTSGLLGSAHLPPQIIPQLLLPYGFGPIFGFTGQRSVLAGLWGSVGGYLSSSLVLFAVLGLFARGRRGLRLVLLAWIVLVFARMYGEPPLLGAVIGVLPGMSRVAFFRYAPPSLELAVIVLAALGLDDLLRRPADRRLVWGAAVALALVAAAAIGAQTLISQLEARFHHRPYFQVSVAWAVLVLAGALAAALIKATRARAAVLTLVLVADAVALFAVPELSAPRAVTVDTKPVAYLRAHLGDGRFFTLAPLAPNYGSYFGVGSLNINDLPIPSAFKHYVHTRLDQVVDPTVFVGNYGGGRSWFGPSPAQELQRNLAGYRAAGVRYVLTPAGQALARRPGALALVFRTPTTWIYELAGSSRYFSAGDGRCAIAAADRARVAVSCPVATALVRRETYMPGWSATIDGHAVAIHATEGLFQTIRVPAGSHQVEFSYAPPNIGWGLVALLLGAVWLLLGPVARLPRARWRKGTIRRSAADA